MARGMAIGYGKANFLGYGKKKLGYGSRHTPEAEMTPLPDIDGLQVSHPRRSKCP